MPQLNIKLSDKEYQAIKKAARSDGRTMAGMARHIILRVIRKKHA